jgi:hypothetical protein
MDQVQTKEESGKPVGLDIIAVFDFLAVYAYFEQNR